MASHRDKLLAMVFALLLPAAGSCLAQTNVHLDSPTKVTFNGERFAFKVDVMGTGNPTLVRHFAGTVPMSALVTLKAKPPVVLMVDPEIEKTIKDPDHSVPCGETSAKVTFYFALDQKNQRALFINLEPGDGVLLDCQLQGFIQAINLGEQEHTAARPHSSSLPSH
jgi:hypothetical protein